MSGCEHRLSTTFYCELVVYFYVILSNISVFLPNFIFVFFVFLLCKSMVVYIILNYKTMEKLNVKESDDRNGKLQIVPFFNDIVSHVSINGEGVYKTLFCGDRVELFYSNGRTLIIEFR